jgi:UDP-glucuronate decarboxylase
MVMAYHCSLGMNTHLAASQHYGPRPQPSDDQVISNFMMQAQCVEPLTVYGGGSQTRCYADGVIEGTLRLFCFDEHSPVTLGNSMKSPF